MICKGDERISSSFDLSHQLKIEISEACSKILTTQIVISKNISCLLSLDSQTNNITVEI